MVRSNAQLLSLRADGAELGVEAVLGDVVVEDNRRLASLAGLGALASVGGAVVVLRNPALASLAPGPALLHTVVGDVYLQGQFSDFSGLEALEQVGGSLVVHALPNLASLRGLQALAAVGGDLLLYLNPALASVAHLSALRSVGGKLQAYRNPSLADVAGLLDALEEVGGALRVDFADGAVRCPQGSGVRAGERPLVYDTTSAEDLTAEADTSHGNWCTLECAHPRATLPGAVSGSRMWQAQPQNLWDAAWAPQCV